MYPRTLLQDFYDTYMQNVLQLGHLTKNTKMNTDDKSYMPFKLQRLVIPDTK